MTMHDIQFIDASVDMSKALSGYYDPVLVVLALVAAYLGSAACLTTIGRIRTANNRSKKATWLAFGGLALGNGVFAMHFIGMLAYRLPIPFTFDPLITVLSGLPAIMAGMVMLHLISRHTADVTSNDRWIGAIIGGLGIGIMHYSGMMAMQLDAVMMFEPIMTVVSVLGSVGLSLLALHARKLIRAIKLDPYTGYGRHISPLIFAAAISSMHYLAMEATYFFPVASGCSATEASLEHTVIGVLLTTLFFILIAFNSLSVYFDNDNERTSIGRKRLLRALLSRATATIYLKVFSITLSVFVVIAMIVAYLYHASEIHHQKIAGEVAVDTAIRTTGQEIRRVVADMNILLGSGDLDEFFRSGAKKRLMRQITTMMREHPVYDQIHLLDNQGMEVIRIRSDQQGGDAVPIPDAELRHRSRQDYFLQAVPLIKGKLYLSRPHFNHIDQASQPVIRLAARVFDDDGQKQGILVLDYFSSVLLNKIRTIFWNTPYQLYLIDEEGQFLIPGTTQDQMAEFREQLADVWPMMTSQESGKLNTRTGPVIFGTIAMTAQDSGRNWKIILRGNSEIWWHNPDRHSIAIVLLICGLILSASIAAIITLFVVSRRISEQAENEALLELEFQKRALDEHAIVSTADTKGNITYVNDKFVSISGYNREELIGRNHRIVKSDEHSADFYREMWQSIAHGQPWHGEIRNLTKEGQDYWVRATIVPFLNDKGKPFKYISVRTDVTAMKQMELELRHAKDLADAAVQAKSNFLANMSHEIRTPMNAVIGLSHLCLQTHLTTKQKDYLLKIYNSATALLRILNDILDFSKIDAGRLDMESIDFTLEDVLGNMAAMIAIKAQEKQIEFLMETDPGIPPSLVGDPLRLGQVLINLANNAIKFTHQGEVVVLTKVLELDHSGVRLQFTIRDTGIGMTEEQVGKLFQAFSQADSSITRQYGGTGLGLTIAQRLIGMMDGTIRVESEPGVGSRFIFDVRMGVSQRMTQPVLLPAQDLRGIRVLVADDNDSARRIMADYLTSFTFHVTTVNSGQEAVVAVQQAELADTPFDLIVMDYMMPGMDGIHAASTIKHDLVLSHVPLIIIATAYGDESVVKRASQEAFVDGFLVKPIHQSLLFESILEAFGHTSDGDHRSTRHTADHQTALITALSGARIVLAEDNEINQQVAQELLEQANITLLLANNGQQAVDLVLHEPCDGVLMDIQMPVMDGLTATRIIRREPRLAHLPIIAMTANAMVGDREQCLAAGMQDHIAKPIDPDAMFATLLKWVKPANPAATPAVAMAPVVRDASYVPPIDGIDTQTGLRRMGGNAKRYRELLAKFRANQQSTAQAIDEAINTQDQEGARRLAHTLKGLAATVGAEQLSQQAAALEYVIRDNWHDRAVLTVLLNKLSEELDRICQALEPLQITSDVGNTANIVVTDAPSHEITTAEQAALLRQAAQQLAVFDADVDNTLAALRQISMQSQPWLAWIEKMEQQVSRYDFDSAAAILLQCAEAMQVQLDKEPLP
ncbi:MAG: response regulator [Magnetococcales bacterium]|nr:response regulator [Magnetococcales bacterium]